MGTDRILRIVTMGASLAAVFVASASGQVPVDDIETWSAPGTAGWTNSSSSTTLDNPGGYLQLIHLPQSRPVYVRDTVRADIEPGVRLTNIVLRLAAVDRSPSEARLEFHAAKSGRVWYHVLGRLGEGTQLSYSVPVTFEGGWKIGPNSSEEDFDADIKLIDWVGVSVTRNADTAKQDYLIDDFRIQGLYVADLDGDGVPNAWEMEYGFDPENAVDAGKDPDGDRMSNYAEYWAGTRPDDEESVWRVGISVTNLPSGSNAVVLSWPSVPDRTYEVLSAPSAGDCLSVLEAGVQATPGTNVFEDATAGGATRIYRVRVVTH